MSASGGAATASVESRDFARRLLAEGLLIDTGIPGVFGRGPVLENLVRGLEAALDDECTRDGAIRVFFPPVTPRETLRRTGFMADFPQLCGSVHVFQGDEADHVRLLATVAAGEDWSKHLRSTELMLTPAACYPLYPTLRGTLPETGRLYDFTAYCFRREPSEDPTRMQAFQVRENVRLGSPAQVRSWREGWMARGLAFLEGLDLPVRLGVAEDPFFGRGGRMMRASQRELELKFELRVPIFSGEAPTACASFNYHEEHFTEAFEIRMPGDETAHSACLGFGLDRIALALLRFHGFEPAGWPAGLRARLGS